MDNFYFFVFKTVTEISIKTKNLKREIIMNLHREHKSAYKVQAVIHMAFSNLGFITTDVINILF